MANLWGKHWDSTVSKFTGRGPSPGVSPLQRAGKEAKENMIFPSDRNDSCKATRFFQIFRFFANWTRGPRVVVEHFERGELV